MGYVLLIIILIYLFIYSKLVEIELNNRIVGFILSFLVVYILAGFVTHTPDWETYERLIKYGTSRDLLFNFFTKELEDIGINYKHIHVIYTGLYTFLMILLISRFSKETYLIALLYIPVVYLYYTTQIRFYLGYFSMSLAAYFWYINRKKLYAVIFAIFAVANHISLILFLPIIYLSFFR